MGARALGRRPWERNSTLFAVILNVFLSRNVDQSIPYLKMRIFLEKTIKSSQRRGIRLPNPRLLPEAEAPPPDPGVVTPVYYYNFVELVSSANCILFRSKKNQVPTA